jgi:IS30 family transposase
MGSFEVRAGLLTAVCRGMSVARAAAVAGVSSSTGRGWWARHASGVTLTDGRRGGLKHPVADWDADVGRALTLRDRILIQAGLAGKLTQRQIAGSIGRSQSVISRELARHRDDQGHYLADLAHARAHQSRRRPKPFKLAQMPRLGVRIAQWMDDGWSPKLIADMLTRSGETERVSHETIYRALYVQGRGLLRQNLARQLSTGRMSRRPRGSVTATGSRFKGAFTISQRPAEAADRAVPGHWEGDLILGAGNNSAIGTLVERTTRYVILLHLPGRHTSDEVADAMIREMSRLPEHLRRSITWDRGSEMVSYPRIQLALEAPVFFCDPHSPWQRGTNENTNRLLRHWFEKNSDLSVHTAEDLERVAATLNARPRPTLDYRTPAAALSGLLDAA